MDKQVIYLLRDIWPKLAVSAMGELVLMVHLPSGSLRALHTLSNCALCERELAGSEAVYPIHQKLVCKKCAQALLAFPIQ